MDRGKGGWLEGDRCRKSRCCGQGMPLPGLQSPVSSLQSKSSAGATIARCALRVSASLRAPTDTAGAALRTSPVLRPAPRCGGPWAGDASARSPVPSLQSPVQELRRGYDRSVCPSGVCVGPRTHGNSRRSSADEPPLRPAPGCGGPCHSRRTGDWGLETGDRVATPLPAATRLPARRSRPAAPGVSECGHHPLASAVA